MPSAKHKPYASVAAKTCASVARSYENAPSKVCSRMSRTCRSVATYVVSVTQTICYSVAAKTCASLARSYENAPSKVCSRMSRACRSNPFNIHFDFRALLRRTSAKISLFTDPGHQQGRIAQKANTGGLGVWLSQSLTFGNLAVTGRIRTLSSSGQVILLTIILDSLNKHRRWEALNRLANIDTTFVEFTASGRCKDVLQDQGVWLSRSLTFGSSAATYEGQGDCPKAPPHRELNSESSASVLDSFAFWGPPCEIQFPTSQPWGSTRHLKIQKLSPSSRAGPIEAATDIDTSSCSKWRENPQKNHGLSMIVCLCAYRFVIVSQHIRHNHA